LRLSDIGKFIEGIMDSRIGAAPAPPAPSCPKDPDRPRQVIGRIPVIERCPVTRIGHFGAYHETALSHGSFLPKASDKTFSSEVLIPGLDRQEVRHYI
jgi:hypothetical protein